MGELQFWSSAASGWASKSFFVRFSYNFKALLKMSWKLDDEAEVMGRELDIRVAGAGVRRFALDRAERMTELRFVENTSTASCNLHESLGLG